MARIVKDPQIRRNELIDVAEELIIRNGYEQTTVSDIVKDAGVAQGTFYHYFCSKHDVLEAIIARYVETVKEGIEGIASRGDINAIEKMLVFFSFLSNFDDKHKKLINYVHEEKNTYLHTKFEKTTPLIIIPLVAGIIEEGIREGLFDTGYPEIAALYILAPLGAISHRIYNFEESAVGSKDIMDTIFDFTERLLGVKPGVFMEHALKMEGKE
ncbi:MAG: TetR/AcrR family transcriptional regulator [Methanosarcinaceae archaeon]|nr:TetR/AcrR family transcriptional regulator [Methanosarcinaceae archaeon]